MASNRVYTESVVTLNNQEATAKIDEIKQKAAELRMEMAKISKEKGINSKEFAKAQKELVHLTKSQKDLNEDTKKFEKILNNLNGASLNQLQSASKKLNQQVRRLKPGTEEFVAASKKLKEVKARMSGIYAQTKNTQSVFGGFFTKIGWAGVIAGGLAIFKKFASDMISQTQEIGDRWRNETAGWQNAYNSFISSLVAGTGWKELFHNMRESYRIGKEVSAMLDEIFERNNSLALEEAIKNKNVEELSQKMRDVSLTDKERLEAAEEIDRIEKDFAERKKDIASQELEANKKLFQSRTHLTDKEIEDFVVNYNNNRKLITQATEYNEEVRKRKKEISNLQKLSAFSAGELSFNEDIIKAKKELDSFVSSADEDVKKWAGTVSKYNLGNDEIVTNLVNSYKAVIDADADYLRKTQRSNKMAASLRLSMSEDAIKARETIFKKEIAAVDSKNKKLLNKSKEAYLAGEISEQQYQDAIIIIKEQGLREKIAIAEKFRKETIDYNSELLELSLAQKKKMEKIMKDIEEDSLKIAIEVLKGQKDVLKEITDEVGEEIEAESDRLTAMLQRSNDLFNEMRPAEALKTAMQHELSALEELHEKGLISEARYQEQKKHIVKSYSAQILKAQLQPYEEAAAKTIDILSESSGMISSLQEASMATLDAQMKKELTAAGDNAEERKEIEEKYAQKKLDVQKKYADVDMAINIAKTIASGALAGIRAFADLGPVAGGIMSGIIAVTTAAQVATIVAQRNAIKNTTLSGSSSSGSTGQRVAKEFYEGGFTAKSSNDYQEVGIVHANEWVAPASMVRSLPITFARLENIRKSKASKSGNRGFADGGFVSSEDVKQKDGNVNGILEEIKSLLTRLIDATPVKAYVLLSEINKAVELENKVKSIRSKK